MDNSIYRGILTGYNAAFIVDQATRDALVAADPKSEELLKPVLRGRDIARYRANWGGKWLISTFPSLGLDIDAYPAIKKHLLSFGQERLAQEGRSLPRGGQSRKKTPNAWYELQDTCAYHEEFQKEKLLWIELAEQGRFSHDVDNFFGEATTFFLTGKYLKFLCAILNSQLVHWFLQHTAPTSGMGALRWKKVYVETVPIPSVSAEDQRPFVQIVNEIITAKNADSYTEIPVWEGKINDLVYDLYKLTDTEIEAVKNAIT